MAESTWEEELATKTDEQLILEARESLEACGYPEDDSVWAGNYGHELLRRLDKLTGGA